MAIVLHFWREERGAECFDNMSSGFPMNIFLIRTRMNGFACYGVKQRGMRRIPLAI